MRRLKRAGTSRNRSCTHSKGATHSGTTVVGFKLLRCECKRGEEFVVLRVQLAALFSRGCLPAEFPEQLFAFEPTDRTTDGCGVCKSPSIMVSCAGAELTASGKLCGCLQKVYFAERSCGPHWGAMGAETR